MNDMMACLRHDQRCRMDKYDINANFQSYLKQYGEKGMSKF